MSEIQRLGFGAVNDSDKAFAGSDGAPVSFGLNTGNITVFEYNPNAGKDNGPGEAIDITVTIGGNEFRRRIYDVTRVYDNKNNQITDETSEAFIKGYNEAIGQVKAVITHTVKSLGVSQQQIEAALSTPPTSFKAWALIMTGLAPRGFESKKVDLFLEYQWAISGDNNKTFLQIPKNMKGGYFLSPHIEPKGSWKEQRQWEESKSNIDPNTGAITKTVAITVKGLRYVDDAGVIHPFVRSENFMESPKANQQIEGEGNITSPAHNPIAEAPASSW